MLALCFGYLSNKDLVNAALVCKEWSIALDTLWRKREVPLSALLSRLDFIKELEDELNVRIG